MPSRFIAIALTAILTAACQKLDLNDIDKNADGSGKHSDTENAENPHTATGHVEILTDTLSERQIRKTFISLKEWSNIPSALSGDDGTKALLLASDYREGELSAWHIPTLDEARRIKSAYDSDNEKLGILNQRLEAVGGDPIYITTATNATMRFLCAGGDSTFTLRTGFSTLKAGATVKYHLRLVKDTLLNIVPQELPFEY